MQHECVPSGFFFLCCLFTPSQEGTSVLIISSSYSDVLMFLFRTRELDLRTNFNSVMTCYSELCKVVQKQTEAKDGPRSVTANRDFFTCTRNQNTATQQKPEQRGSGTCEREAQPYCITSNVQRAPDPVYD